MYYRCALPMCGDPRCASDPRHASQECRVICENRVKVRLDGHALPHYIYSVVAALRMLDALDAHVSKGYTQPGTQPRRKEQEPLFYVQD